MTTNVHCCQIPISPLLYLLFQLINFPRLLDLPPPPSPPAPTPSASTSIGYLSKSITLHVNKSLCSVLLVQGSCKHLLTGEPHQTLDPHQHIPPQCTAATRAAELGYVPFAGWKKRIDRTRLARMHTFFISGKLAFICVRCKVRVSWRVYSFHGYRL